MASVRTVEEHGAIKVFGTAQQNILGLARVCYDHKRSIEGLQEDLDYRGIQFLGLFGHPYEGSGVFLLVPEQSRHIAQYSVCGRSMIWDARDRLGKGSTVQGV